MQSDALTRLLLAGILVCLIVLVAQGFGSSSGPGLGGWGRYQVMGMRAGTPVLIRTDTVTGEVSKLELRGGRDHWVKLTDREESDEPPDTAEAAPEPAAPPSDAARRSEAVRAALAAREAPAREAPRPAAAPPPPPPPRPAVSDPRARSGPRAEKPDITTLANAVRRSQLPPDIRVWAVAQLADREDPESTEVLLEALDDADPRVVAAAIKAVGERDDPRVSTALDAVRSNPDPGVQEALDELVKAN